MFEIHRRGLIYDPMGHSASAWMKEFAQCPTPLLLNDDLLRVFIATRPERNAALQYVSYPTFVDVSRNDLFQIKNVAERPVLELGKRGMFDEFGVMPSCLVKRDDELLLYYSGWTRAESVPYLIAIGVASSRDGGRSFQRLGDGSCLGLGIHDPYFVTGPMVQRIGQRWHMWYLRCTGWPVHPVSGRLEPMYRVAHATSDDALQWECDPALVLPALSEHECQDVFAPFFDGGQWHAIFAHRDPVAGNGAYRLGYACSDDLTVWQRLDATLQLTGADASWDAEMMCYPQMLKLDGRRLMFYCGNGFGRTGFGLAEVRRLGYHRGSATQVRSGA